MDAFIVSAEDLSADLETGWRDLATRAREPNPFFEPDFVLPAAQHLDGGRALELVFVRDGTDLRACIPVTRVPRRRKLPWPGIATWRHPYCYLGTPLLDRDAAAPAVDAVLTWLRRSSRPAKYLALEWVNEGSVMAELVAGAARARLPLARTSSFERALLQPMRGEPPFDETAETWKRLAQRRRSFERTHGHMRYLHHTGDDPLPVERFLTVESSGWKGDEGTALASRAGDAAFFREMIRRFANAGRVELRELAVPDGQTLAMSCRIVAGPETFCFKVGYNESYRKFAPGLQLEVDTVREIRDDGATGVIDSCADPSNDFFNKLFHQRRVLSTLLLPGTGMSAKPLVRAVRALRDTSGDLSEHQPGDDPIPVDVLPGEPGPTSVEFLDPGHRPVRGA